MQSPDMALCDMAFCGAGIAIAPGKTATKNTSARMALTTARTGDFLNRMPNI